ncbi:MAG: hypothetical protein HKN15_12875 [Xanthomonadales bacterium]|nr:hypothetical protein [Xanthomonadales bacterium]
MSNFRCALLLVSMAGWTATAFAHPDIIAQIQQADRQLEENPANVGVLLKRGELYRRHGEFEAAASDLVEARDLRPSHPLLNFYEGRLALDTHDFKTANQSFSQQIEIDSNQRSTWYWRGKSRLGLQRYLAAAEDFRQAIELSPRPTPELYRSLTLAYVAAGKDQLPGATAAVAEGLNHLPREINLLGLGVDLSLSLLDSKRALAYLSRVPQKIQELPQWQFRRAVWWCLEGQLDDAGKAFSRLLDSAEDSHSIVSRTWNPPTDSLRELSTSPVPGRCSDVVWESLLRQAMNL